MVRNQSSTLNFKLSFLLNYLKEVKPANFFVVTAILFQILYTAVTPPIQAPDELNHFYRAYQISEGCFLPQKINNRLGGEIPKSFQEFLVPYKNASTNFEYKINAADIFDSFKIKISNEKEFQDFPNTSYYSPVSYLPQAIAIFLLKQFNCSIATMYYGGKFFVFVVWLLCMFFVIKTLPIYKWLFTALVLLPMNLYITNSYSADTVTCILSFMFISTVLNLALKHQKVSRKDFVFLLIIVGLLAMAKVVYIGLVIMLFLIPLKNFNSRFHKTVFLVSVFLVAFLLAFLWSSVIMKNYTSYANYNVDYREISSLTKEADYYAQKSYILNNGLYFFKVIVNSLINHPKTYLLSYIGCFGTYLDIPLPDWICFLSYLIIGFLALTENNAFRLSVWQKVIVFSAAFFSLVLLLLSQHLTWDAVGVGVVNLLQGRYLIPIFPLVFILLNNSLLKLKFNLNLLVMLFVAIINLYSVKVINERFIKETYYEKIEFYCDAESVNKHGQFTTSNPKIMLENGNLQSNDTHVSGKSSVVLSPASQYGFTYHFKGLNFGDLVEIEAWKKGDGGHLVISGKGSGCNDFYYSNKSSFFTNENGWSKMSFVFTMTEKCINSDVTFFVWNPSVENVYFDDIKFVLKKLKKNENKN